MRTLLIASFLLLVLFACRERYGIPLEASRENLLVVEGNILSGDTTKILLSRTSLVEERRLIVETGASVQIEGDDNSLYPLSESAPGTYKSDFLSLNNSSRYRLKISAGSKQYESDWLQLISTPAIDSVLWQRSNGVEISVLSRGSFDDTRYYKWDYDEVWEFHSVYEAKAFFNYEKDADGQVRCLDITRDGITYNSCVEPFFYPTYLQRRNDSMYRCWRYENSNTINIGSTAALADNTVLTPVKKIEDNAWELSWLYSILVKQTGLTKEGYEFYQILKANSEGLGTIFDAQPSQMKSNLRCVTDPQEAVIGFVDATTVMSRRLFISASEVPEWYYYDTYDCVDTLERKYPGISVKQSLEMDLIPAGIISFDQAPPYQITLYSLTPRYCADCRVRGVSRKPEYWPQ